MSLSCQLAQPLAQANPSVTQRPGRTLSACLGDRMARPGEDTQWLAVLKRSTAVIKQVGTDPL